ncbi:ATP-binding cassette domain-containing protein [Paenalkalicoccus suaedae]|uniref:ATP-binding cassette domain-containing protein n=1 Tax=Paenalkalicoccus suaedae TaxID=2592382 RepID=A0A859FB38_9BACI|nr:ATP-binding cassette domain-containing protein [Paenalkalicoccus suaedae]QKS70002.1 ATP-binding cassette domain-containing protein [Paenalkalicoccus suaedae]
MITFDEVTKSFTTNGKDILAVDDVSLTVNKGEIFGIIGFSGAGKSTLLRLVNLLESPTKGRILIGDQDIQSLKPRDLRRQRQQIGMIFQNFNLFSSRTVFGNVAYPLRLARKPKREVTRIVNDMLDFVGLKDKADHYPEQLSGGQKQRVGIARALATSPEFLICDEATSALDPDTTDDILRLLKKVNEEYGITILLITHEMHVIKTICDRVAVMENGRVIESGNVFNVFSNPQTATTKNFISSVLNDRLSIKLLTHLRNSHTNPLYRVIFKGESTNQPLLSKVTRKYDLDFNIAYGSVNELQDQLYGNLIVEFIGDPIAVQRAIEELATTVEIREVINHGS